MLIASTFDSSIPFETRPVQKLIKLIAVQQNDGILRPPLQSLLLFAAAGTACWMRLLRSVAAAPPATEPGGLVMTDKTKNARG